MPMVLEILREERHFQPGLQKPKQLAIICSPKIADDVTD